MIYEILENPKTEEYCQLKNHILSHEFNWFYNPSTIGLDPGSGYSANYVYGHKILEGPNANRYFPEVFSEKLIGHGVKIVEQILNHNNIKFTFIYRMVVNSTFYDDGLPSPPHLDHDDFFHKNLIVYLNEFDGGNIDIFEDDGTMYSYKPHEDDIITFDFKKHSVNQPTSGRRVVFVATYL